MKLFSLQCNELLVITVTMSAHCIDMSTGPHQHRTDCHSLITCNILTHGGQKHMVQAFTYIQRWTATLPSWSSKFHLCHPQVKMFYFIHTAVTLILIVHSHASKDLSSFVRLYNIKCFNWFTSSFLEILPG